MPIADRDTVFDDLRAWLARANSDAAVSGLRSDTDIIESRILESLQVVELILYLERKSGRRILAEDLNPDTLRSLDSIYTSFFEART